MEDNKKLKEMTNIECKAWIKILDNNNYYISSSSILDTLFDKYEIPENIFSRLILKLICSKLSIFNEYGGFRYASYYKDNYNYVESLNIINNINYNNIRSYSYSNDDNYLLEILSLWVRIIDDLILATYNCKEVIENPTNMIKCIDSICYNVYSNRQHWSGRNLSESHKSLINDYYANNIEDIAIILKTYDINTFPEEFFVELLNHIYSIVSSFFNISSTIPKLYDNIYNIINFIFTKKTDFSENILIRLHYLSVNIINISLLSSDRKEKLERHTVITILKNQKNINMLLDGNLYINITDAIEYRLNDRYINIIKDMLH